MKKRREAHAALEALQAMSDRDLHDMGLARCEIDRVAWEPVARKR
jgi:uncharacterized protein YjiS (DUF1127 family)